MFLNQSLEIKKNFQLNKKIKLYDKEYKYLIINLKKNSVVSFKNINLGTIVPLNINANSKILFNNEIISLKKYTYLDFSKRKIKINSLKNNLSFLIAGIKKNIKNQYLNCCAEKILYKVVKPWGHEIWINGEKKTYSIKKILIKKGFKTSLQFHQKKIETNFIFKGRSKLYYSGKNGKHNKNSILNNLKTIVLHKNNVINVKRLAVHRIEALTNLTLFEVSTPHLDDVIRIEDDKNRKSGRINAEHIKVKKKV